MAHNLRYGLARRGWAVRQLPGMLLQRDSKSRKETSGDQESDAAHWEPWLWLWLSHWVHVAAQSLAQVQAQVLAAHPRRPLYRAIPTPAQAVYLIRPR